jgi:hypothetical protein
VFVSLKFEQRISKVEKNNQHNLKTVEVCFQDKIFTFSPVCMLLNFEKDGVEKYRNDK